MDLSRMGKRELLLLISPPCNFCDQGLSSVWLYFFVFLGPHRWHMEVPRLGVELELQLPAYTTAAAMLDPNHICDLHHRSWQSWILNPLSEARNQTCILMDTSQVRYHWAQWELPGWLFLLQVRPNYWNLFSVPFGRLPGKLYSVLWEWIQILIRNEKQEGQMIKHRLRCLFRTVGDR